MKRRYLINGSKVIDKKQLHDYLKHVFNLPDYYGHNLDALWDCLSTNSTIEKITIIHSENLKNTLGEYNTLLLNLFNDLKIKKKIEFILYKNGRGK